MTLLSMCQQVCRETGTPVPTLVYANTDQTAQSLLACAQSEGKELARGRIYDERGSHIATPVWNALRKEQTFYTTSTEAEYEINNVLDDNDFGRFIANTIWDRTNDRPVQMVSAGEWQIIKGSPVVPGIGYFVTYRGKNKSLWFSPTPSVDTDLIAFEYVSSHWCESAAGAGRVAWAADTDTGILDEDLMALGIKWRFLRLQGESYMDELAEYRDAVRAAAASDDMHQTVYADLREWPIVNVPETGYGQ